MFLSQAMISKMSTKALPLRRRRERSSNKQMPFNVFDERSSDKDVPSSWRYQNEGVSLDVSFSGYDFQDVHEGSAFTKALRTFK